VAVVVFIIFVYANVASCMLIKCALTADKDALEDWVACLTQMPRIVLKAVWPHCDLWSKAALTWANKKCVSFLYVFSDFSALCFCMLLPVTALIAF